MKYWKIIADDLSKAGWSWGRVSTLDCEGRTIWIADAHRGDGKRFVVRAEEKLRAFLELESAIRVDSGYCNKRSLSPYFLKVPVAFPVNADSKTDRIKVVSNN